MKYLILLCTLGLTISLAAQQASTEKQNNIQFSGGYSRHIKHNLDGFSIDITGIKAIGKNWFLQYGGGFQQYWGKDNKYDDFINALDGPIVQLEGLAPLRLQTAGIQIQAGIGRKINRHLTAGVLFWEGTRARRSRNLMQLWMSVQTQIQVFRSLILDIESTTHPNNNLPLVQIAIYFIHHGLSNGGFRALN